MALEAAAEDQMAALIPKDVEVFRKTEAVAASQTEVEATLLREGEACHRLRKLEQPRASVKQGRLLQMPLPNLRSFIFSSSY